MYFPSVSLTGTQKRGHKIQERYISQLRQKPLLKPNSNLS